MKKFYSSKSVMFILTIMTVLFVFTACKQKEPIKIGFIGNMTELAADLGVDGRNGVILCIEKTNEQGGIDGRQIELSIKDDKGNEEQARRMHQEFENEGVELIIGHLMSSMAQPMLENQGSEMMFLTPSMSTNELADLDDFIIRSTPTVAGQAVAFIEDVKSRGIKSFYVVFDSRNANYSERLMEYTVDLAKVEGVEVKGVLSISDEPYDYEQIADEIIKTNPDSVFMLTSSIDTAFISQRLLQNSSTQSNLYSVSWSMTRDMIENGGKAVEGMRLIGIYIPEYLSERYFEFESAFDKRFGYSPTFISELTYDATALMLQAIDTAGSDDPVKVKQAIVNIDFNGLKEDFSIDKNGDSNRKYLIHTVKDNEFVPEWK